MKICFVIPRIYAYFDNQHAKFAGGAERQTYYLAQGLSKKAEFEVSCVVADFGQEADFKIGEIRLIKSFQLTEGKVSGFRKLIKAIKKADADLYIYRSADVGTAASIFFQQVFLRKKVLYMVASNSEISFSELKKMSGLSAALLMPFAYKTAYYITSQSKERYNNFTRSRKRKPDALIPNITKFLAKQEKNEPKNGTLWVGRLDPVKQPEIYIDLAKKYPNHKFTMIAPIIKEHKEFGEQVLIKVKKTPNIKYFAYISPDKIEDFYQKAQIYAITSYTEGFSNTMAEAIVGDCAILSFNVNPDSIITQYNFGYFAKNQENTFYEKYKILIDSNKLCKEMARNGKGYLQNNHSEKAVIKLFSDLILRK